MAAQMTASGTSLPTGASAMRQQPKSIYASFVSYNDRFVPQAVIGSTEIGDARRCVIISGFRGTTLETDW